MHNLPAKVLSTQEEDARALIALAREVAAGIHDLPTILKNHHITEHEYDQILKNPFFARTLEAEVATWTAAHNTPERIRIEAAATLENWLPTLHARLQNLDEALPGVVEGGKLLAKLAGMDTREGGAVTGEKFVISINLGAGQKIEVEKTIELVPEARDEKSIATPTSNSIATVEGEKPAVLHRVAQEKP